HPATPARSPAQRADDSAGAIAALRGSRFDDAAREATTVLARDPGNAQAAAVRAIATYEQGGSALVEELGAVLDQGESFKALDHERGRAAWQAFLDRLDAVDRDLAVVAADPDFSLELCLACWERDWNHSGHIDDRDRRLFEIEYDGAGHELPDGDARRRPTFRFDVGDADWARAMVAFQRAFVEIVLAYRWSELDRMFGSADSLTIRLADAGRVQRARTLVLAGLGFADRARQAYLAETDDDREWVPSPRQKSHPLPLAVDEALYRTWEDVLGDVRALMRGDTGLSVAALAQLGDRRWDNPPRGYLDIGRMLSDPKDIVFDFAILKRVVHSHPETVEAALRSLFGSSYVADKKPSGLLGRLGRMKKEIDGNQDTFGRKLRYFLWLN
ncbi:MAG TPA: hypothetical protein VKE22_07110, partial [Haliangiales bacterium]|nr:hypothetical protein [Haliangiales bacterium]